MVIVKNAHFTTFTFKVCSFFSAFFSSAVAAATCGCALHKILKKYSFFFVVQASVGLIGSQSAPIGMRVSSQSV